MATHALRLGRRKTVSGAAVSLVRDATGLQDQVAARRIDIVLPGHCDGLPARALLVGICAVLRAVIRGSYGAVDTRLPATKRSVSAERHSDGGCVSGRDSFFSDAP